HVRVARLSGSGATCFGLCTSLPQAQLTADELRRIFPNDWIVAAKIR
ncbi:MAG: hypothetical protein K2Q12_02225, partial [Rickettsiales bacterium]|nr:hypothetical protein [Rickettsiales bacterium]